MLERLAGNEFYCFLDGFSGYFQIPIDPQDQEKTTFTCPYGTFAYRPNAYHLKDVVKLECRYRGLKRILERTKAYWALKRVNFDINDSKIKNRIFNVGDQVLLFNSRLKIFSGKLKTRWSGPFTIAQVFPYGTVELSQPDGLNFKVNGHRVKHYIGGDLPPKVVPDLHTLPKDN
ncbi:hypothetical protein Tco_1203036 [Tanacetum coccineum]